MRGMFAQAKAVLFDLDGTLVDSAPDLGAAVDKMRVERGLPPLPLARYRSMAGAGARGMLGEAFGIGPDHPDFPAMREEFFQNYQACLMERTLPFGGVAQLMDGLAELGLPWGIVTNKSTRFSEPLTRGIPLFSMASTVVSGDTTPYVKPHPAPLLEAAERMRIAPCDCIYVGDDKRDIQAGHAAGMGTVAAVYGYLGLVQEPLDWGAHAIINFPLELLQLLDRD